MASYNENVVEMVAENSMVVENVCVSRQMRINKSKNMPTATHCFELSKNMTMATHCCDIVSRSTVEK